MNTNFQSLRFVGIFLLAIMLTLPAVTVAQDASPEPVAGGITVVASGLTNPRGFSWGPDGTLYMAMAGTGGDAHFPVAEGFTGDIGLTSSVDTINGGCATPAVSGLVSFLWEEAGWIWGAMDVAFLGDDLYVLLSGAGPSNLSPASFSGVFRVNGDGTMTLVGDITTWLPQNPPSFIPPDYGTDGSLFDLEATSDALILSEAVGGQVLKVTPDGTISSLADLSEGHLVPTGLAVDATGNIFVGYETTPPYTDGSSKVSMIAPDGTVTNAWTGLTAVTDVVIGPDGVLYAAEMSTGNTDEAPFLQPNTGRVVRQTGPDSSEAVVTEIDAPVNLGFDANGQLFITTPAFSPDRGVGHGALLEVDLSQGPVSAAGLDMSPTCA